MAGAVARGRTVVPFVSILGEGDVAAEDGRMSPYFGDLNLDQLFAAVTKGREEYDLEPFFYGRLPGLDAVVYRQEVARDLDDGGLPARLKVFADRMRSVRTQLAEQGKRHHLLHKQLWFLEIVALYLDGVRDLADDLAMEEVSSRGLRSCAGYFADYTASPAFDALCAEAGALRKDLYAITYSVHIKGRRVRVARYAEEADYSSEVRRTFEKFAQRETKSHLVELADSLYLGHVEARILELVARLNPEVFTRLAGFYESHSGFLDPVIVRFDREVQFYLAYLDYIAPIRAAGLGFCYPDMSESPRISAEATFDLALAGTRRDHGAGVVPNDLRLTGDERILVVTGPNQGGKTTFARTFGQLHHLAALGLPVPGRAARLMLCDRLFTHFERAERPGDLHGKLQDDLIRVRAVMRETTARSVIILNEIFTSTTLEDARYLGTEVLRRVIGLGALCVCVTFVDELASLGPQTVSMVASIDPEDPAYRTYEIVRRPADGLAYAAAIAEKYELTYEQVRGRIQP